MKKYVALFLIAVTLLTLAACGSKDALAGTWSADLGDGLGVGIAAARAGVDAVIAVLGALIGVAQRTDDMARAAVAAVPAGIGRVAVFGTGRSRHDGFVVMAERSNLVRRVMLSAARQETAQSRRGPARPRAGHAAVLRQRGRL